MFTAIIQVRLSSKRLKNKAMIEINKNPIIYYVRKRVENSKNIKRIIIACSDEEKDDPIYNYCISKNYLVERGNLHNVVDRYLKIIKKFNLSSFVRITGDSPCIDPKLIDKAIKLYINNQCDLLTNVFPRSYPKGVSVEVVNAKTFQILRNKRISKFNKEHITSYFYENSKKFRILNFKSLTNQRHKSLALDTKKDLYKLNPIIKEKNFINQSWRTLLKKKYKL